MRPDMPTAHERLDDRALADIQGILTTGYGHLPQSALAFLTIRQAANARAWLRQLVASITSSAPWPIGPGSRPVKPTVTVNLAFTADGLRALGLSDDAVETFPIEFREGMAARARVLGDVDLSEPPRWELGGPSTSPVHAMLLLFAGNAAALDALWRVHQQLLDDAARGGVALAGNVQYGYRPDSETEPFGFRDGLSQPRLSGLESSGVPTGEFILGYQNHYGLMPPTAVVSPEQDPAGLLPLFASPYHAGEGLRDLGLNGSYLVYRKLQQDVAGFWRFMQVEVTRDGPPTVDRMVWLASKCVGRWPSGAPLVLAPDADDAALGGQNEFQYSGDLDGRRCPLGAHIRRTNPRDVLKPYPVPQSLSMTEAHRLLRRGRVYGPPLFNPDLLRDARDGSLLNLADDGRERGIHFLALNASVKSQFEFVQQTWCNNPHFGGLTDNPDPLVSTHRIDDDPPGRMAIPVAGGARRSAALPNFVTVRAGAYLFLPSLTALRFLASSPP